MGLTSGLPERRAFEGLGDAEWSVATCSLHICMRAVSEDKSPIRG